jgi:prolyl-tRNA editing enzyme YbaK/EbsC (Cys-tRNA(Pro) deacylase)
MRRERVVVGGGSRSWKVVLDPASLLSIPGATVVEGLANDPAEAPPAAPSAG